MDNYLQVLRNEFGADESFETYFLIQIRVNLNWDKATLTRLVTAMERCCEEYSGTDPVERWMALGFWYVPRFVRDWTTHPNFPQEHESEYYQQAYQRLDDLAYWFFWGESPYQEGIKFEPM